MTENIKISQEELDSLISLRERIRSNVETVGRLNIKKHFTESELAQVNADLMEAYAVSEDLAMEETRVVSEITTKYGDGDLNFETGVYIPNRG